MTIADLELERIASRGWQAVEEQWVGGWLLRANGGFTGRANSVLPLAGPGMVLDAALDRVHAFYGGFDLAARFAVPRPACDELREDLLARGWTPSWSARVMVADLADLPDPAGRPPVAVLPHLSDGWESRYHYRDDEVPAVGRALLERADVVGFAQVVDGDAVVAIGRGTVVEGWLGITAVEVSPDHRRRGLATAVLAGLGAWARSHGATRAYLQVATDNDVARAMYERSGFTEHHTYRYLDAPAG